MIAAAMPAMNPLPFLNDMMPPEGAGTALPPDFAALIAQLNALPANPEAVTPQVAATPDADAAPDTPEVKLEADDGSVPEGLEDIADTLAAALAAVLAAASNAVAAGKAQAAATPGSEPAKVAATPVPTLTLVQTPAPSTPVATTPPAIAAAIATAGANLAMLIGKDGPATDAAATIPTDLPSTDQADAADALPDLLRTALSTPLAAAPVTAAPIFAAPDASSPAQAMSSSDIVMTHHLDMAKDGQWLDQLARDIARTANHESQLRFQLNPEHLGSLRIELANTADGTSIRMTADTEAARNMLVDAQPRLVAEARAQGLRISGAQVDLGGHGGQQRGHEQNPQAFIRTQQSMEELAIRPTAIAAERYA